MNPLTNVKNLQKMNERMLQMGVEDSHGWHKQYKDSAYVFIGGLPYGLTEGDILCVFSQYGEIVNINLVRDKKTAKTKGFCFLCYEDQRSTVLAVDNFNGIKLGGRTIRVDHCSNYRRPLSDEKDEHGNRKEIVEVGCAPKTPPQSEEDKDILELPKKRKKEKKEKKLKKNKGEKSGKKRKTASSSEEDNDERKQKLDLLKKESSRNQEGREKVIKTDRHRRIERDASHDHDKNDFQVDNTHQGRHYGDVERDHIGKRDCRYDSPRRDCKREHKIYEHDRKRNFHDRDMGVDHDRTYRDNRDQHSDDHRDSAYRKVHDDRDHKFDERRRDRFDKKRGYRSEEGREHERQNRNNYGDRKDRR